MLIKYIEVGRTGVEDDVQGASELADLTLAIN